MAVASIIIPAYNAQAFLRAAVASAQAQTEPDIEILVCDDCSTDQTEALARSLAAEDPRIRVFRTPRNSGPSAARNIMIDAARGDWIVLLDADDRFDPHRTETLVSLGEEKRADLVADNSVQCDESGALGEPTFSSDLVPAPQEVTFADFMEHSLGRRFVPRGVTWVGLQAAYRRSFLVRSGIRFDESARWAEDYLLYVQCFLHGASMWVTPQPLYLRTCRPGSLTDTPMPADLFRVIENDRRLLCIPHVAADHRLRRAVSQHLNAFERWYDYRIFADAVKARAFTEAAGVAFGSVNAARHVLHETLIQSPIWLTKQVRLAINAAREKGRPRV